MVNLNIQILVALTCGPYLIFNVIVHGMGGTAISSIQDKYQLQSAEVGIITAMSDTGIILSMIIIAIAGENINKPRWISVNSVIIAIGSLLYALPHFISPPYEYEHGEFNNYCGNVTESECKKTYLRNYRFIFMAAMLLLGIGYGSIFTHGITYIDDNTSKKDSSLYVAIFYSMASFGPVIGFLTGGAFTELFVEPDKTGLDIDSKNPLWIGAWWPGFLLFGGLTFLISIPVLLLPPLLPGIKQKESIPSVSLGKRLWVFVKLMKNPIFVISCIIVALNQAFIHGFNTFGIKYLEAQVGLTTFLSAIAYGTAGVVFLTSGYYLSGIILSKFNLQINGMIKFCLIGSFLSVIFTFVFFFRCKEIDFAIGNLNEITDKNIADTLLSGCNQACNCSSDWYNPVRGSDNKIYFSPCFAGCVTKMNKTNFMDCYCVSKNNTNETFFYPGEAVAIDSLTDQRCAETLGPVVAILLGFAFLTSVITTLPTTQITLRCVEEHQRSSSIGVQQVVAVALGNIPGRALPGKVLDLGCIAWSTKCGELASCKLYKKWDIALYIFSLLFTEGVLIFLLYILMHYIYNHKTSGLKKENGNRFQNPAYTENE